MAISTATITIFPYPKGIDNTQRMQVVRGTIAISAGDYPTVNNAAATGGWALSWAAVSSATGTTIQAIPIPGSTPSSTGAPVPVDVDVHSTAYRTNTGGSKGPSGYVYLWDSVNGNLHLFVQTESGSTGSGPLVEYAGPIPGDVVNDTIQFTAYFWRN